MYIKHPLTGNVMDIPITPAQLKEYEKGGNIQVMFPHLNSEQCEFFMTGWDAKQQRSFFGIPEDFLPLDQWVEINAQELDCIFAEDGCDRELDFDREAQEQKLYEQGEAGDYYGCLKYFS